MENALSDFLHYCRVERRLAPLTCSASSVRRLSFAFAS